jgi:asparagine synthase (glutamine-hydrolysing)
MCGIFGVWQRDGGPVDLAAVRQATSLLRHRGPDDEGYLLADTRGGSAFACAGDDTDPRLGLPHIAPLADAPLAGQPYDLAFGFRRLAILDLSPAGHQPMSSPDGRFWLIFNGEVYNYLELREELRGFGHGFRSGSDSEVILAAYAQWGSDCLARFNGMWALAIWDRVERSLFLARDRFGVKPLYYAAAGSAFRFASEIKALVGRHGLVLKPSAAALYDYLAGALLPSSQGGQTFFDGVRSLPPGRWLMVRREALTEQRFWALSSAHDAADADPAAVATRYRELFIDAVRLRLRSDVAVGTCLSGGVDSSSIVCTINRLIAQEGVAVEQIGERQKTFSAVYDTEGHYNERPHIERVLQATGAEGNFVVPTWESLRGDLARLVWHQDEPFLSTSIFAQWCVMRLAHARGITVLLDGQGADEQLGGYLPYVLFLEDLVHRGQLGRAWQEARDLQAQTGRSAAGLMARALSRQVRGSWIDGRRRRRRGAAIDTAALNPDFAAAHGAARARWWRDVEQHTLDEHLTDMIEESSLPHLLRYEDRNSMAFSIESRVPFLDYRFVQTSFAEAAPWRIHAGWSKWILREAMAPLVPPEIIWRKDKVGFETPEVAWTQRLLAEEPDFFDDALCRDYLNVAEVRRRLAAWPAGGEDVRLVWRWINLAMWLRVWHGAGRGAEG